MHQAAQLLAQSLQDMQLAATAIHQTMEVEDVPAVAETVSRADSRAEEVGWFLGCGALGFRVLGRFLGQAGQSRVEVVSGLMVLGFRAGLRWFLGCLMVLGFRAGVRWFLGCLIVLGFRAGVRWFLGCLMVLGFRFT